MISGLWKAGCYAFLSSISSWKRSPSKDTQYGIDTKVETVLTKHIFNEEFVLVFTLMVCNFT
jgi:hypothetical protein